MSSQAFSEDGLHTGTSVIFPNIWGTKKLQHEKHFPSKRFELPREFKVHLIKRTHVNQVFYMNKFIPPKGSNLNLGFTAESVCELEGIAAFVKIY